MREFGFWQKWLSVVSLVVVLFGLSVAFLNNTYLFKVLFSDWVNKSFWGAPDVAEQVALFQKWIYGLLGAAFTGWGIFMFFVARGPFKRKERWAWNCFAIGLLVWFILDTWFSYQYGIYSNIVTNVLFLLLLGLPLVYTRKDFIS